MDPSSIEWSNGAQPSSGGEDQLSAAGASPAPPQVSPSVATPATRRSVGDASVWPQRSLRSGGSPGRLKPSISAWRWPARDGELPVYVQRMFRVKVFGLLSIQLTCIFCEMLLVEAFLRDFLVHYNPILDKDIFFLAGMATICLSAVLHYTGNRFPLNYILLFTMTCLVGLFWGLAPFLPDHLHFQLIGILAVAMSVSTAGVAVLTRSDLHPQATLLVALALGWIAGCTVDLVVVTTFGLSSPLMTWSAMLVTLFVLALVLMLDAGRMLTECNPDDFARVIVVMDSALLLVSLPIFLLACCFLADTQLRAADAQSHPAAEAAAEAGEGTAQARRGREASGSVLQVRVASEP